MESENLTPHFKTLEITSSLSVNEDILQFIFKYNTSEIKSNLHKKPWHCFSYLQYQPLRADLIEYKTLSVER